MLLLVGCRWVLGLPWRWGWSCWVLLCCWLVVCFRGFGSDRLACGDCGGCIVCGVGGFVSFGLCVLWVAVWGVFLTI